MLEIVVKTIQELFNLLQIEDEKKQTKELVELMEKESLAEIHEGLHEDLHEGAQSLKDAKKQIEDEAFNKIVETACSKVLVNYFADNKKHYNERQKEIFLTFLLTNKLKRELEKTI